jgi:hypothetical protein
MRALQINSVTEGRLELQQALPLAAEKMDERSVDRMEGYLSGPLKKHT